MESLGILAGGIAHDFNNLLTAILGNLNLARAELPPEAPAHPLLGNIEKAALKASELTRQMLAYAGRGNYVVTPQDLNHLVRETACSESPSPRRSPWNSTWPLNSRPSKPMWGRSSRW